MGVNSRSSFSSNIATECQSLFSYLDEKYASRGPEEVGILISWKH